MAILELDRRANFMPSIWFIRSHYWSQRCDFHGLHVPEAFQSRIQVTVLLLLVLHQNVACDTYDTNWCCDLLLSSPYLSSPLQSTLEDIVLHMAPRLHQAFPSLGHGRGRRLLKFSYIDHPTKSDVTSGLNWAAQLVNGVSICQDFLLFATHQARFLSNWG